MELKEWYEETNVEGLAFRFNNVLKEYYPEILIEMISNFEKEPEKAQQFVFAVTKVLKGWFYDETEDSRDDQKVEEHGQDLQV